jgi:hypothetical protein
VMKIGLVGEAPNDTRAIQNLLSRNYHGLEFVELLQRVDGSMLDNKKAINQIRREFELEDPDLVIFMRDLDSHEGDTKKKRERQATFTKSNRIVDKKGIHLLHIYEIEALILADIEVFNKQYNCDLEHPADPMKVADPKEILIAASRKSESPFNVSHNPDLFKLLNLNVLIKNCRYFSLFIKKFNKAIGINR